MKKIMMILIGMMVLGITYCSAEQPIIKPVKEAVKIPSMELTNIPITTAIAQIARAGEFSVVISPEVPNTIITATFKNVPAELALQTVCDAAGLANQKKEENVYIVSHKVRTVDSFTAMMKEMAPPINLFETQKRFEERIGEKPSTVSTQTCPVCKKQFRSFYKAEYCPYCGMDMCPKCTSCGKKLIDPNWSFCPYCGKKTKKDNN
ncbi:MAG: zinc ribbon domain-containing protein [bacterium]